MDRYEVPIDAHLAPLVAAAERGEDVIIMRDGREVARVATAVPGPASGGRFDVAAIQRMQERIRALGIEPFDAADAIRKIRDEGY